MVTGIICLIAGLVLGHIYPPLSLYSYTKVSALYAAIRAKFVKADSKIDLH